MPPVGHLSCKQTKRKVRILQRQRGLESWLHSLHGEQHPSSFHTHRLKRLYSFTSRHPWPPHTTLKRTVCVSPGCSLHCELLEDKHAILLWNLRCRALGLTNSKSSLRSSIQIRSNSRAFALAVRGKSCPVSSLYSRLWLSRSPFKCHLIGEVFHSHPTERSTRAPLSAFITSLY